MRQCVRGLAWYGRLLLLWGAATGMACGGAYRQAEDSAAEGNWDTAVAYYQQALQDDPDRPEYRIALARAMINASRVHISAGRAFESQGEFSAALREFQAAAEFDPSNSEVVARAATLERDIRAEIEAARPPAPIDALRQQARIETAPPLLNPASREPLTFEFRDTSLQVLVDFIGDATGINVTYDDEYVDTAVTFRIDGMTLEESLNFVLTVHGYFYKVLNDRTIIVVPENPQKRAQYDEQVIQTFYVSHANVEELAQLLSQIVRVPQMAVQPAVIPNTANNTITVRATAAVTAIIAQVISANDKPRAEIIIDVEILEVNRERAQNYGLNLADYSVGAIFSPEVSPPTEGSVPAFNLNTLSRGVSAADFYSAVPSAFVRFLENDVETNLVAKPQLRGQEGETMTLNLGEDIPVPQTAFTALAAGGATVNPLTSFQYRPVGVIVEMTPRVTYENEIILELTVENSTLGPNIEVAGNSLPTFGSRRVETVLRLRDGEPNLLAGLIREEDRSNLRGIIGTLGIPLLRSLFGNTDNAVRTTDIVMLLTPRVVRTHELTQRDVSPIHIGTQTNLGLTGAPPLIAPRPDAGSENAGLISSPDSAGAAESGQQPAATAEATGLSAPGADAESETLEPSSGTQAPSGVTRVFVSAPGTRFSAGGGPYTVPVSLTGASQLSSISLTVFFDPTVLEARTVQEGSFLRQGGTAVTFTEQVDATAGRIDMTITRLNDSTGAAGAGLLAAILFEARGVGSTPLTVSGSAMSLDGGLVALDFGQATVTVE